MIKQINVFERRAWSIHPFTLPDFYRALRADAIPSDPPAGDRAPAIKLSSHNILLTALFQVTRICKPAENGRKT